MTLKTLAAAACISLASATTAISAPITLDFSFDGVTGTFYGLDDNDGMSSATSFDLSFVGLTWTGVPIAGTTGGTNAFEFDAGDLVAVDFELLQIGVLDTSGAAIAIDEFRLFTSTGFASFYDSLNPGTGTGAGGDVKYTINPVSAVPLPAGGLLLLSAFGGVAALKRRKKRAA